MSKPIKPVISFTLDEELIKRIEDFQFANRLSSRSKAAAKLIEMALDALDEPDIEKDFDPLEEMDKLMNMLSGMKESMEKHRKEGK